MNDKGLVRPDEAQRAHIYQPVCTEEETQQQLIERAFGGSTTNLVRQALVARKPSAQELDDIRQLLDDFEGE